MTPETKEALQQACAQAINAHNFGHYMAMVSDGFLNVSSKGVITITKGAETQAAAETMAKYWAKRIQKFFTESFSIEIHVLGDAHFQKFQF